MSMCAEVERKEKDRNRRRRVACVRRRFFFQLFMVCFSLFWLNVCVCVGAVLLCLCGNPKY